MKKTTLIVSMVCLMAGMASAALLPVDNASFESADGATDGSGWEYTSGVLLPFANATYVSDGANCALFNVSAASSAVVYQQTANSIVSGQTYTLSVDFFSGRYDLSNYWDTFAMQMWADDGSTLSFLAQSTLSSATDIAANTWATPTVSYVADGTYAGQDIYIQFQLLNNAHQPSIDNVQLDAVPEPATLGLVAMFGAGMLFIRRKLAI
ncbi:MAG: PEP-CTERM sorting domain-containing protein [Verrucomicrobiota bacterium]